jgi:Ca-activated chloride channel family protein
MEGALDELKAPGTGTKQDKSGKSTKSKWLKIFAYAAAVIIVSGIVIPQFTKTGVQRFDGKGSFSLESRVPDDKNQVSAKFSSQWKQEVAPKRLAASKNSYQNVAFSPDGKVVASPKGDYVLSIEINEWPIFGMTSQWSSQQHAFLPDGGIAFLPDGGIAFSPDGEIVFLPDGEIAFLPDGKRVVGFSDGSIACLSASDYTVSNEINKWTGGMSIQPRDAHISAVKTDAPSPTTDITVRMFCSEMTSKDLEAFLELKKEREAALGTRKSGAADSWNRYCKPLPGPGGYPMAHGGTTPPNGEDVDAMFFKNYGVNPFVDTEDDHLSTFATDVDTGSYTIVRRYLHEGHLPPEKAVRVEEFVNYFNYGYAAPQEDDFAVYAEAAPWMFGTGRKNSYLLRLGLKGKQVSKENRKPAILTFVIDVSGSMRRENRLGLVKRSLRMLVERLREEDQIGIAVYGSRGRKVMDHRGLYKKADILSAIESLEAGGSTNAEEGIRIGYEMAENAYRKGFINRVILCSDGVANVGQTFADDILEVIRKKAEKGITLSAIGFGMGNYNDVLLERLGDKGNGHYVYIDTIVEARRVFEDNLTGTLQVIGRDVKVQVDFNPEVVRSYRLIGYENRDVPDEKFHDDKHDGGEIGAGHSVTALYELKLWPDEEGTVATTYVRYKHADTSEVTEFKSPIAFEDFNRSFDGSSSEFKLAATVAEFAEILRKSYWAKGATLERVLERAQQLSREFEDDGDVIELVDLISKAERLMKDIGDDIFEIREPIEVGEGEDEFLQP